MARSFRFGLAISWPIIAGMFVQTWLASRWVAQIDSAIGNIQYQMQAVERSSDARLTRLENIYFKRGE